MSMLSVVIPAYNEEGGIQDIMDRILAMRSELQEVGIDDLELIIVDDGSTDRTREIVAAQEGVTLIKHAQNGGYGAALKTGFAAAQGEWIGFMDADGTYPPEYYPKMCKAGIEQNADIVVGSRMAGADSEMPKVRRLGNLIFARLVSIISAQKITDSASGQRVFKQSILERIYPLPDGLNLTPVMSTRALHEKLNMIEVSIPYSERAGDSKLSVIHDGLRFAQSIVWTALNYNPVRPLGLFGLLCVLISAFITGGLFWSRFQGITTISAMGAFALFAALVLGIAGINMIVLGMSFNYFVALFHKSPVRQGLFGRPLFEQRLDRHFGWVGIVSVLLGLIIGMVSLWYAFQGMALEQLWFYYLGSTSLLLIGIQLGIAWIQMQVLEALRIRESLVKDDLRGKEHAPADPLEKIDLQVEMT